MADTNVFNYLNYLVLNLDLQGNFNLSTHKDQYLSNTKKLSYFSSKTRKNFVF